MMFWFSICFSSLFVIVSAHLDPNSEWYRILHEGKLSFMSKNRTSVYDAKNKTQSVNRIIMNKEKQRTVNDMIMGTTQTKFVYDNKRLNKTDKKLNTHIKQNFTGNDKRTTVEKVIHSSGQSTNGSNPALAETQEILNKNKQLDSSIQEETSTLTGISELQQRDNIMASDVGDGLYDSSNTLTLRNEIRNQINGELNTTIKRNLTITLENGKRTSVANVTHSSNDDNDSDRFPNTFDPSFAENQSNNYQVENYMQVATQTIDIPELQQKDDISASDIGDGLYDSSNTLTRRNKIRNQLNEKLNTTVKRNFPIELENRKRTIVAKVTHSNNTKANIRSKIQLPINDKKEMDKNNKPKDLSFNQDGKLSRSKIVETDLITKKDDVIALSRNDFEMTRNDYENQQNLFSNFRHIEGDSEGSNIGNQNEEGMNPTMSPAISSPTSGENNYMSTLGLQPLNNDYDAAGQLTNGLDPSVAETQAVIDKNKQTGNYIQVAPPTGMPELQQKDDLRASDIGDGLYDSSNTLELARQLEHQLTHGGEKPFVPVGREMPNFNVDDQKEILPQHSKIFVQSPITHESAVRRTTNSSEIKTGDFASIIEDSLAKKFDKDGNPIPKKIKPHTNNLRPKTKMIRVIKHRHFGAISPHTSGNMITSPNTNPENTFISQAKNPVNSIYSPTQEGKESQDEAVDDITQINNIYSPTESAQVTTPPEIDTSQQQQDITSPSTSFQSGQAGPAGITQSQTSDLEYSIEPPPEDTDNLNLSPGGFTIGNGPQIKGKPYVINAQSTVQKHVNKFQHQKRLPLHRKVSHQHRSFSSQKVFSPPEQEFSDPSQNVEDRPGVSLSTTQKEIVSPKDNANEPLTKIMMPTKVESGTDRAVDPSEMMLEMLSKGKFETPLSSDALNKLTVTDNSKPSFTANGEIKDLHNFRIKTEFAKVGSEYVPVRGLSVPMPIPQPKPPEPVDQQITFAGRTDPAILAQSGNVLDANKFKTIQDLNTIGDSMIAGHVVDMIQPTAKPTRLKATEPIKQIPEIVMNPLNQPSMASNLFLHQGGQIQDFTQPKAIAQIYPQQTKDMGQIFIQQPKASGKVLGASIPQEMIQSKFMPQGATKIMPQVESQSRIDSTQELTQTEAIPQLSTQPKVIVSQTNMVPQEVKQQPARAHHVFIHSQQTWYSPAGIRQQQHHAYYRITKGRHLNPIKTKYHHPENQPTTPAPLEDNYIPVMPLSEFVGEDQESESKNLEPAPKCIYNPCRNGGSCTAYQDRFHCTCKFGWVGDNCERHSNCIPNPCVYGECSGTIEGFTCTCKPGYKGKHCDTVQRCHPNPCMNGGTCTEVALNVYCDCKPGFKGKLCEYEEKCSPINPCMNGGTCLERYDKYYCQCKKPYEGFNCELLRPVTTMPPVTISMHMEGPQAIPSPVEQDPNAIAKISPVHFANSNSPFYVAGINHDTAPPSLSKSVFSPSQRDPPPFVNSPLPYSHMGNRVFGPEDLPKFVQDEIKTAKVATLNTSLVLKDEADGKEKSYENWINNDKDKSENKTSNNLLEKSSVKHEENKNIAIEKKATEKETNDKTKNEENMEDLVIHDKKMKFFKGVKNSTKDDTVSSIRSGSRSVKMVESDSTKRSDFSSLQDGNQVEKSSTTVKQTRDTLSKHNESNQPKTTRKRSNVNPRITGRRLSADVKGRTRSGVTLLLKKDQHNAFPRRPMNNSLLNNDKNHKLNSTFRNPRNVSGVIVDNDTIINHYSDKVKSLTSILTSFREQKKQLNLFRKMNNMSFPPFISNSTSLKKNNLLFFPPGLPFAQTDNAVFYVPQRLPPFTALSPPSTGNNVPFIPSLMKNLTLLQGEKHDGLLAPSHIATPYANMRIASLLNYNKENKNNKEPLIRNSSLTNEGSTVLSTVNTNDCPAFCRMFCDPWCSKIGCCTVTRDQMAIIRNFETRHGPLKAGERCPKCHQAAYCKDNKCICQTGFFGDGIECKRESLKNELCSKCNANADCIGGDCFCVKGFYGDGNKCWPLPIPI